MDAGAKRMAAIEKALAENTEITEQIRDFLAAFRGGFRVLGWLGSGAKWVGGLAGAAVAIYSAVYAITHNGNLPGK